MSPPVADQLIGRLHPDRTRLLLAMAHHDHTLLGWVALAHTPSRLVGHWATVHHLQTHLAVRGGIGLEAFYARLGWREIGRWPDALRLAPGDDRDEGSSSGEWCSKAGGPDVSSATAGLMIVGLIPQTAKETPRWPKGQG
jgi:hypothetical protein